jgi:hypothetical protein
MFVSDDGVDVYISVFNEKPLSGNENSPAALLQSTLLVVDRIATQNGISQAVKAIAQRFAHSAGGASAKPDVRWYFRKPDCSAIEEIDGSLLFLL